MTDWFRSWHGAPTDMKWLVIAKKAKVAPGIVSAVWFALEDHASQQSDRGSVASFSAESYSAWSGFPEKKVAAVLAAMVEGGVIVDGRLASWDKRQPKREEGGKPRGTNPKPAARSDNAPQFPTLSNSAPQAPTISDRVEERRGEKSSEANASAPAVAAPPDERAKLFEEGLATVVRITGKPRPQCRSLIGRWLKLANDDCRSLNRLIEDAEAANPIDVVAWIEGHFRSRAPPGREPNMAALSAQIMGKLHGPDDQNAGSIRAAGVGEPGVGAGDRRDGERGHDGRGRGPPPAGQGAAAGAQAHGGGKVIDLVAEPRRVG